MKRFVFQETALTRLAFRLSASAESRSVKPRCWIRFVSLWAVFPVWVLVRLSALLFRPAECHAEELSANESDSVVVVESWRVASRCRDAIG